MMFMQLVVRRKYLIWFTQLTIVAHRVKPNLNPNSTRRLPEGFAYLKELVWPFYFFRFVNDSTSVSGSHGFIYANAVWTRFEDECAFASRVTCTHCTTAIVAELENLPILSAKRDMVLVRGRGFEPLNPYGTRSLNTLV